MYIGGKVGFGKQAKKSSFYHFGLKKLGVLKYAKITNALKSILYNFYLICFLVRSIIIKKSPASLPLNDTLKIPKILFTQYVSRSFNYEWIALRP